MEQTTHNYLYQGYWCIVTYIGHAPYYYCGYYDAHNGDTELKPAISSSFDLALKLHGKEEAERIRRCLKIQDWKVEEHAYM